jgi:uncharacterized membrane protein
MTDESRRTGTLSGSTPGADVSERSSLRLGRNEVTTPSWLHLLDDDEPSTEPGPADVGPSLDGVANARGHEPELQSRSTSVPDDSVAPAAASTTTVAETVIAPTRRWWQDHALLFVIAGAFVWFVVMYLHVWRRHDRFGTFDHDLGFHANYIWLLGRGEGFSEILGLHAFGHNATFGYLLLAPLTWFGFGPQGLDFIATATIAAGAVFLFRYARAWIGSDTLAIGAAAAWLLHPVNQLNVWETFHPENMVVVPLIAAYHASREHRWRAMWLWGAAAIIWKTDVALTITMLGVLVALRGSRKAGAAFAGAGLVWFIAMSSFVVPAFGNGSTVYGPLFGDLGDSPFAIAKTALTDPTKVTDRLSDNEPVRYGRDLAAPFAFTSLASPGALLLGVPQATVNLLTTAEFTWNFRQGPHYQGLPVIALALGMVDGLAVLWRRRRALAGPAAALAVGAGAAATVAWGALEPLQTRTGLWSTDDDPRRPAREEAIRIVGPNAPVSAHYLMVPHLTTRETVFVYPNPWKSSYYYSPPGEPLPDPMRVRFIIMDRPAVPAEGPERVLWDCINGSGAFVTRLDSTDIVVLERIEGVDTDRACIQQ